MTAMMLLSGLSKVSCGSSNLLWIYSPSQENAVKMAIQVAGIFRVIESLAVIGMLSCIQVIFLPDLTG